MSMTLTEYAFWRAHLLGDLHDQILIDKKVNA